MIDAFEQIAATLNSPMIIATTRAGREVDGCLVGFSTQCSIDPTRYVVCLSKRNKTYRLALDATTIVVHMLHDADDDRALAELFGEETGREVDKISACRSVDGPDGVPVLATCDWFAGTIIDRVDLGDHVGFVLDITDGQARRTDEPWLSFEAVRDLDAGNPA
jgi:flavin reductase (DIM6/NTAB) family NADH-FMN oxidoreductase RutF